MSDYDTGYNAGVVDTEMELLPRLTKLEAQLAIVNNNYKQMALMLANIHCDYNNSESCRKLILSLRKRARKALERG